jgi:hypothetical protein
MPLIKNYIANYLLRENIQKNQQVSMMFINSLLVKDEDGYLLEEAYIEEERELNQLIDTGVCEDTFFQKVYESILSSGFKYFAKGSGRIVFTHNQAPNLIFKLVIPGEELDGNIAETRKEKEMMLRHPHLFGELYNVKGNIPSLFNNSIDYFIIVERLIPLFTTNFVPFSDDKVFNNLKSQFGYSGSLSEFKTFLKEKLIKYYELAFGQETEDYAHIKVPASPPDMLDNFCEEVIKFSKEVKPDNVGLKVIGSNRYKFVMLDV